MFSANLINFNFIQIVNIKIEDAIFVLYMNSKKIGILREAKFPPDARVPLVPAQIEQLKKQYPEIEILVQPGKGRCYANYEFEERVLQIHN